MTASNTLALFKAPVARGGNTPDSALPPRADHRSRPSTNNPRPTATPAPLTQVLPDTERTLLLGFALVALPSVVYSVLQMSTLLSGGVLENAIRAFVR